jgi:hypothetical protein
MKFTKRIIKDKESKLLGHLLLGLTLTSKYYGNCCVLQLLLALPRLIGQCLYSDYKC